MEEKLQYTLTLATRASGNGAAQTAQDLGKVAEKKREIDRSAATNSLNDFLNRTATSSRTAYGEVYELGRAVESVKPPLGAIQVPWGQTTTALGTADSAAQKVSGSIKNLGNVTNQVGYQITDFAVQVQGGQSAMTAFSQQAPQLIGALQQINGAGQFSFSTAIGTMTGLSLIVTELAIGVPMVVRAFQDMKTELDYAAKAGDRLKESYLFQVEARKKLSEQILNEKTLEYYTREAEALERQEAALKRLAGIRSAQGNAASANAAANVTMAQNSGGDVQAARFNQIAVEAANKLQELDAKIAESAAAADTATRAAEAAKVMMIDTGNQTGEFSDDYKKAVTEYEKAANTAEQAGLDLQAEKEQFDAAQEALKANTTASLSGLQADVGAGVTKLAEDAKSQMETLATETGGKLSATAKNAYDRLSALLGDTVPDAQQMQLITTSIEQFRTDQSVYNKGMNDTFLDLLKGLNQSQQRVQFFNTQSVQLLSQIQADQSAVIEQIARLARTQQGLSRRLKTIQSTR